MHTPSLKFSSKHCLLAVLLAQVCMMQPSFEFGPGFNQPSSSNTSTTASSASSTAASGGTSWRSPLAGLGAAAVAGTAALAYSTYAYLNKKLNTNYEKLSKNYKDIIHFVHHELAGYDFSPYAGYNVAQLVRNTPQHTQKKFLALVKTFNGQSETTRADLAAFRSQLVHDISLLAAVDSWTARALPNYEKIVSLKQILHNVLGYVDNLISMQNKGINLEQPVLPPQRKAAPPPTAPAKAAAPARPTASAQYNAIMAQKDPSFTGKRLISTGTDLAEYNQRINDLLQSISITGGAQQTIQAFIEEITQNQQLFVLFIQETRNYIPGSTLGNQFITMAREKPQLFAKVYQQMPHNLQDLTWEKFTALKVDLKPIQQALLPPQSLETLPRTASSSQGVTTQSRAQCPVTTSMEQRNLSKTPAEASTKTAIPTAGQSATSRKYTPAEVNANVQAISDTEWRRIFKGGG